MAAAASVVVGLMHGDGAVLPIGRGFHPVLAQPTFVNEMPAQGLGSRCLGGDPGIAVAGRKTQARDRVLQKRRARALPDRSGVAAMQPSHVEPGARVETLLLARVGDFHDDESTRTGP
jgi:hypothetical protein